MRTYSLKISILTFFTALSAVEASSIDPDIVDKVARPRTTTALQREKILPLPEFSGDRTQLVLSLHKAIGPDFEEALFKRFGNTPPTDGLTQKQIAEILNDVALNKNNKALEVSRNQVGARIVRSTLEPVVAQLTINNNFLIQNFGATGPYQSAAFLSLAQRHLQQVVYPGGTPNPALIAPGKENYNGRKKRLSYGEIFPLAIED